MRTSPAVAVGLLLLLALLVLPLLGVAEYWIYILTIGFYYAILAASWSLLVGYVGRISFAQAAFAGLGAYASALATTGLGWPVFATIPLGVLVAALVGLVIGRLCLELHGAYLGLTTIAFSEILRIAITAEYELTRGSLGLSTPGLFATTDRVPYYYTLLAALLGSLGVMWLVLRSRIGLFFHAIREDEEAAASLGVRVGRWKLVAFTLSSAFAGLAGGLYAHVVQLVSPAMMSLGEMGLILSMAVIGGFHNIVYAALGGLFLEVLLEGLREIGEWRLTLFGFVVIVILRYAPNGFFGALARRLGAERRSRP
ncbi:MAG TPA: branched-chain amino acid ABC transporter permease [Geminicoccaceae bacterium]|nr:branched-chain amino acid ABC transporter permease [Geminicoccaceae bacterium]